MTDSIKFATPVTPRWTQDQAIAYECARELITHMMASLSEAIVDQENSGAPNIDGLERLRTERSRLHHERARLLVTDVAEVARIRTVYGALVRVSRVKHSELSA
jgi:hypothetical protein